MLDAYLEPWGEDLREAALVGEALGCVYQALSYRAIEAACEPGDRRIWADEPGRWLARARELASKL
jgi:hypothetical protein